MQGSVPADDPREGRQWVTVGSLSGSCDRSSPTFALRGIDTRMWYRNDADSFVVFLVDAREGLEATAGYAEVECAARCSGVQVLVPPAGQYSLRVQAVDGPWEVAVQEYREP